MRTLVWSAGGAAAAAAGLACLAAGWVAGPPAARAVQSLRQTAAVVETARDAAFAVTHWQFGEASRLVPAGVTLVTSFKPDDGADWMPYILEGDDVLLADVPCPATMPYCEGGCEPLPAPRCDSGGCPCCRKCCGRGEVVTWWRSLKSAVAGRAAPAGGSEECEATVTPKGAAVIPVPGGKVGCPAPCRMEPCHDRECPGCPARGADSDPAGGEESEVPVLRKKTPTNLPGKGKSKVDTMECRPADIKMMPKANPDF